MRCRFYATSPLHYAAFVTLFTVLAPCAPALGCIKNNMDHHIQHHHEPVPGVPDELDRVAKVALAGILLLALSYLLR